MTNTPTPHLVHQALLVATMIEDGLTYPEMAARLGVSRPRISQIRRVLPELREYIGRPIPTERLKNHRAQLFTLRRDALRLALAVRKDIRSIDQELEAERIDRLLGLRR